MWTSLKAGAHVVVKQIPIGIGMGIGVAIATSMMDGLSTVFGKGRDALKKKADAGLSKVVAEHAPTTSAQPTL